jgi:hypothetical protein
LDGCILRADGWRSIAFAIILLSLCFCCVLLHAVCGQPCFSAPLFINAMATLGLCRLTTYGLAAICVNAFQNELRKYSAVIAAKSFL